MVDILFIYPLFDKGKIINFSLAGEEKTLKATGKMRDRCHGTLCKLLD